MAKTPPKPIKGETSKQYRERCLNRANGLTDLFMLMVKPLKKQSKKK